ncbi:MAG: nuclear transport factor 2 family protein, partial [Gammaproteobacteria bacterium]
MTGEQRDLVANTAFDLLAAQQLLYRYCFAVDMGTLDEVMALFAPECDLIVEPGGVFNGRAAVQRWYAALVAKRMDVLRHLTSNQVVDLDGECAHSKSYWDAVGDLKGEAMVAAGFYEDDLCKFEGEWKYVKKIIRIDYMTPLREGWG